MHYRNGREAKLGDKVIVPNGNYSFIGVVTQLVPGAASCNLHVVPLRNAQLASSQDCIHVDDALAAPPPPASP